MVDRSWGGVVVLLVVGVVVGVACGVQVGVLAVGSEVGDLVLVGFKVWKVLIIGVVGIGLWG
jgi:hypothetical protein